MVMAGAPFGTLLNHLLPLFAQRRLYHDSNQLYFNCGSKRDLSCPFHRATGQTLEQSGVACVADVCAFVLNG